MAIVLPLPVTPSSVCAASPCRMPAASFSVAAGWSPASAKGDSSLKRLMLFLQPPPGRRGSGASLRFGAGPRYGGGRRSAARTAATGTVRCLAEVPMHLGAASRLLSISVVPFVFSVAAFGGTFGGAEAGRVAHATRPPEAHATYGPLGAPPGRTVRGWLNVPAGSHEPLLYVVKNDGVAIYSGRGRNPQQVGALSQSGVDAYDVYVDRHGTVYVVNWEGSTPGVNVYPPGATQPSLMISAQLQRPLFAIVDHTGRLYVSDGDTGQIVVYRRGRTVPERILSTNGFEADGMAFDAQGNLFVAYRSADHDG